MISRHFLKGLPTAAAMLVLYGAPLHAADFAVTKTEDTKDGTCDTDCSLREAIDAANAAPDADTITLPAGTYQLKLPNAPASAPPFVVATDDDTDNANVDGDLDVLAELTINGAGATTTIIDGNGVNLVNRVFHVDPTAVGASLTLNGITVQGGVTPNDGGGIQVGDFGALQLVDSRVLGNETTGGDGGGICFNSDGSLTITGSTVSDNIADSEAGGIDANDASAIIADTIISNNTSFGNAGGLKVENGNAEIFNSRILGNTADGDGGGIDNDDGVLHIVGSEIRGNKILSGTGGGVRSDDTLVIEDSIVAENEVLDDQDGGGIHNGEFALVRNTSVSDNRSQGSGGGIYNDNNLTLENSTVSGNVADTDEDDGCSNRGGGGIYSASYMTITGSVIKNNVAQKCDGGGIHTDDNFSIAGSIIADNTASNGNGGGVYNGGCDIGLIASTTVSGNQARGEDDDGETSGSNGDGDDAEGGGIWTGCAIDLVNSTVVDNKADGHGGGLLDEGDIINVNNTTIAFNTADANDGGLSGGDGGGLFVNEYQIVISNSIVAGNQDGSAGSEGADCFVLDPASKNSLVIGGPTILQTGCNGLSGFTSLVANEDPQFDPAGLSDNGGLEAGVEGAREKILTLNLQATSPAIDAGDTDTCRPDDQRLTARPQDGNGDGEARCDLGAVEVEAGGGATTGGDTTGGDTTGGETTGGTTGGGDGGGGCALQADAQADRSSVLGFGAAILGLLALFAFRQRNVSMASKLKAVAVIVGLLAAGSAEAATRHVTDLGDSSPPTAGQLRFILQDGALSDDDVIVFDLDGTITLNPANGELTVNKSVTIQGNGASNTVIDAAGGAFRVFHVNSDDKDVGVVLSGMTITGGKPAVGDGGGILVAFQGALTVRNCIVTGNEVSGGGDRGGGIAANEDGDYGQTVNVIDSEITLNKATSGDGGGISTYSGTLIVKNSVISGNEASGFGGGIFTDESGTEITDSRILNNIADSDSSGSGDGGGISNSYTALSIVGTEEGACLIDGNKSLAGNGGGLHTDYTTAVVNCTISNNEAPGASGDGGAIYVGSSGVLQLVGSTLTLNKAGQDGGAIYNDNQLEVLGSIIDQNTAADDGGGIHSDASLRLSDSSITKNEATTGEGGGLNVENSFIENTTVSENQALANNGGGIFADGVALIANSAIVTNKALAGGDGGGIYVDDTTTLANVTVSGNEADSDGGGIYSSGVLLLNNATIAFNTATADGGGVYNGASDTTIANSVIASNTGASGPDCFNDFSSGSQFNAVGPSIVDDKTDCDITGVASAVSDEDPLLVGTEAVDNGGPTFTIALQEGSPALDAGDASLCESTDQRGIVRPQGEGCDLGAFELEVEEGGTTGDTTGGDTTGGDTTGGTTGDGGDSGGGCSLVR